MTPSVSDAGGFGGEITSVFFRGRSSPSILDYYPSARWSYRRRRGFYYEGRRYRSCKSIPDPDARQDCESYYKFYFITAIIFLGASLFRGAFFKSLFSVRPTYSSTPEPKDVPLGKISKLIREYALRNPAWDETKMNFHGRTTAISYFKTLESGDIDSLKDSITANFEKKLRQALALQLSRGAPRFENLKCASVEITYAKDSPACFVIRANMQAERVNTVNPVPFTGYFTYRIDSSGSKFLLDSVEVPKFV
jgi:hypothetical protein